MQSFFEIILRFYDMELKVKLDRIVSELARCQVLNGGEWIGSIPEKYFTRLINDQYIWSPQYTLHKTIIGLTHGIYPCGQPEGAGYPFAPFRLVYPLDGKGGSD